MSRGRALSVYLGLKSLSARLRGGGQERGAHSDVARPEGLVVWITGTDAGTLAAISGLMPRLSADLGIPITPLITAPDGSETGPLPGRPIIVDPPGGTVRAAEAFVGKWRPALLVVSGAHLPVAAISHAGAQGIPVVWIDTATPRQGLVAFPRLTRAVTPQFTRVFPFSTVQAQALGELGIAKERITQIGPLREDTVALTCIDSERDDIAAGLGGRPVWLAANTALEDIDVIDAAHRHVSRQSHRMLMIVSPAPDADAAALAAGLAGRGWVVLRRSDGDMPTPDCQVWIADQPGEDGLWYRIAPISVLMGTFAPDRAAGNPFEPAALGSAIVHGPHVGAQAPRFTRLQQARATRRLDGPDALGSALEALLSPDRPAILATAAWRVVSEGADAADRVVEALEEILEETGALS